MIPLELCTRTTTHVHIRPVHEYSQQPKIGDLPKAWSKEPVTNSHTEISKTERDKWLPSWVGMGGVAPGHRVFVE